MHKPIAKPAVRFKSKLVDHSNARIAIDALKTAQSAGIDVGEIPRLDILSNSTLSKQDTPYRLASRQSRSSAWS
ncbi:hypothetical protein LRP30_31775 [Bradyrhizobium sp. C-145]|uniref:hypothetical protein n=1 Tax=Bradyrhizobium sp. C-145 TaxID=574727 RepID=UPI00201B936C|nr:hypothetical protein [Bradyrhizobium sp. C-145]UQR61454.1 hypothetical protein LRP30_31775 [Bradyrhizobium sp. C-145]